MLYSSKWFTKNNHPENVWVASIVECAGCGLQTCSWYLALSRCRMAKSFNSLPPTKGFDNTMVDADFEELQCGVSEENIIRHHFIG